MKTILNIDGMSCQNCVRHVKEALSEINGVANVSVSLENKTADVEHEESATLEAMKEAVEEAGYDVR